MLADGFSSVCISVHPWFSRAQNKFSIGNSLESMQRHRTAATKQREKI